MDFKIALRVGANRTYLRRFGAHNDMTAVAAFPNFNVAFFKDLGGFDVVQQGAIPLFVVLFDRRHRAELGCQLGKAFFFSGFGKAAFISEGF